MKIRITGQGLKKAQFGNWRPPQQINPSDIRNSQEYKDSQKISDDMNMAPDAPDVSNDPYSEKSREEQWRSMYPNAPKELKGPSGSYLNQPESKVGYVPPVPKQQTSNNQKSKGLGMGIYNTLELGNAFGNLIQQPQKQRDWYKKFRDSNLTDNAYAVTPGNESGNRGDYDINNGMFRPNETGFKSKGMYTNNFSTPQAQYGLSVEPGMVAPSSYSSSDPLSMMSVNYTPVGTTNYGPKPVSFSDFKDDKSKGSISVRNNNPGNMMYSPFTKKFGAEPGSPRPDGEPGNYAYFPDLQHGLQAQKALLTNKGYANLDLTHAINRWITGDVNRPGAYTANTIAPSLVHKKVGDLTNEELDVVQKGIVKNEDTHLYKILKQQGIFDTGGETSNMKIRITAGPDSIDHMAYGGQKGYGFDLGQRNTYSKMNQSSFADASNTIQEVPRDEANIEAEKGETVYGDLDGDGILEQKMIGGRRHSEGGTALNVPEGSFIFSDTKKMKIKDSNILKYFGKTSVPTGGITPADIAKQYNITKYKAILQDPLSDPIAKKTAEMMITNMNAKLSKLADVQEGMKGFPQGRPKVATDQEQGLEQAAYGGYLQKYQLKGQVTEEYRKRHPELNEDRTDNPFTNINDVTHHWSKQGYTGKQGDVHDWQNWISDPTKHNEQFNTKFSNYLHTVPQTNLGHKLFPGVTNPTDEQLRKGFRDDKYDFRAPSFIAPGEIVPSTLPNLDQGERTIPFTPLKDIPCVGPGCNPSKDIPHHDKPVEKQKNSYDTNRGPWWLQDKINLTNATANWAGNKKYLPYIPDVSLQHAAPTFEDWRGQAGALQSGYQNNARVSGIYGPSSALNSNLSSLAGQQAEQLAGVIGGVGAKNTATANQFAEYNTGLTNSEAAQRAQNRAKLWEGNVIANQQYDNANREGRTNFVNALNQGFTNAANTYNENSVNPHFGVDPSSGGNMYFKGNSGNIFNQKYNNQGGNQDYLTDYHNEYQKALKMFNDSPNDKGQRDQLINQHLNNWSKMNTEKERATTNAYGLPKGYARSKSVYTGNND